MKITRIDTREKAEAFLYFLAKEAYRHRQDIIQLEQDIEALSKKWNLKPPIITADTWIEP